MHKNFFNLICLLNIKLRRTNIIIEMKGVLSPVMTLVEKIVKMSKK